VATSLVLVQVRTEKQAALFEGMPGSEYTPRQAPTYLSGRRVKPRRIGISPPVSKVRDSLIQTTGTLERTAVIVAFVMQLAMKTGRLARTLWGTRPMLEHLRVLHSR
jgi:hypothetical protein